eukprot:GHVU01046994.1.p1 GENE.GHVU01046994.1~~GHVU01046994.1.p1  ORF type:complete len:616 (-),score=84.14 GHVU01046994.1:47-1894(-)
MRCTSVNLLWHLFQKKDFRLKASVAITTIHVLGQVMGPVADFAVMMGGVVEGLVSLRRYQTFMQGIRVRRSAFVPGAHAISNMVAADDVDESSSESEPLLLPPPDREFPTALGYEDDPLLVAYLQDATFAWVKAFGRRSRLSDLLSLDGKTSSGKGSGGGNGRTSSADYHPHIASLTLTLRCGDLVVVVGQPGTGKSSFISSLLGEMKLVAGKAWIRPLAKGYPVGYCSQTPFVACGTVRDNILFGRELDEGLYRRVVEACQLWEDFNSWPNGDSRFMDEGGFVLSGGQRVRLALARAVYSLGHKGVTGDREPKNRRFLFCLDEVFSSLDPRVGFAIFWDLFGEDGLLAGSATVATVSKSNLQYFFSESKKSGRPLGIEARVVVLEPGRVAWQGSPQEFFEYSRPESPPPAAAASLAEEAEAALLPGPHHHDDGDNSDTASASRQLKSPLTGGGGGAGAAGTIDSRSSSSTTKAKAVASDEIEEETALGAVSWKTYRWYFRRAGWWLAMLVVLCCILRCATNKSQEVWITKWTGFVPSTEEKQAAGVATGYAQNEENPHIGGEENLPVGHPGPPPVPQEIVQQPTTSSSGFRHLLPSTWTDSQESHYNYLIVLGV